MLWMVSMVSFWVVFYKIGTEMFEIRKIRQVVVDNNGIEQINTEKINYVVFDKSLKIIIAEFDNFDAAVAEARKQADDYDIDRYIK